ncbi:hypothetical protein M514_04288 [Trichuris suis]|uniref:Uncharacterized protein n=1 Tax=Trichuris suis TaxID=68888 RepID=A0A085MCA8_9BILA|nr:hypothetical protein M513_04288 [Trichuris suis]KFD71725.1 hypothetical protein M514_04288 [Trichuris suis]
MKLSNFVERLEAPMLGEIDEDVGARKEVMFLRLETVGDRDYEHGVLLQLKLPALKLGVKEQEQVAKATMHCRLFGF